jgi:putative chitinase
MLTPEIIRHFAPHAKQTYVDALAGERGWQTLSHFGIAANHHRLAGFLANVWHETGGLTIGRESLNYSSAARLRQVWPSRFGRKSDGELAHLLHNEHALACEVYNGRMGNRPGSTDGYDFRGWGLLQCTGLEDTLRLCAAAGVDAASDPSVLDDANVSLIVACSEWHEGGCNELMDGGHITNASARINTGNASRVNRCVGLADRVHWYRAWLAYLTQNQDIMSEPNDHNNDNDTHWLEHAESA